MRHGGTQSRPATGDRCTYYALSPPLYDAAREHLQAEIVADPEAALDPGTLRALEEHVARGAD